MGRSRAFVPTRTVEQQWMSLCLKEGHAFSPIVQTKSDNTKLNRIIELRIKMTRFFKPLLLWLKERGYCSMALTEKEVRNVAASAFKTLGHGQTNPNEVPAKTVAALQCALESGELRVPLNGNQKVQTALLSGVLGLLALSGAANESQRLSAATQLRRAA